MKVAWLHNFNKDVAQGSGVFIWQLQEKMQQDGYEIKNIYIGNLRSIFSLLKTFRHIKKEVADCDLIHAQYGSLCGFVVSFLRGKKLISLRGSDWYVTPYKISPFGYFHGMIAHILTSFSLRKYNRIITMSKRMKAEVKAKIKKTSIKVIPSGVNYDKFYPMDRLKCRSQIDSSKDENYWVLFSSVTDLNLLKRKSLALAALEEAKKTLPNIEMRYINNIPHELIPIYINASNLILLTSTHEGWPNIIKEGLACNIPFVSTDVSDLQEIAHNTANCFVVDDNAKALGEAIVKSLREPKDNNLQELILDMEISSIAQQLSDLYLATYKGSEE